VSILDDPDAVLPRVGLGEGCSILLVFRPMMAKPP
jgi:hypothetical protein